MKLSFEINRQDYADFNKFHFIKTRLIRTLLTGGLTIIVLQMVLNKDEFDLNATIISSLVCGLIYFVIYYRSLSNTSKIPADNGTILGHRDLEFNDAEIICKTKDTNSSSGWTTAKELAIGKKALYLYIDTNMAVIIPKRVFTSDDELTDFIKFVSTKVKTTA
jgi:hypothetical protein